LYFRYSSRSEGSTNLLTYHLVAWDCFASTPRMNRSFASIFARSFSACVASSSSGIAGRSSGSPFDGPGEKDGPGGEEGAPIVERDGFPASGGVFRMSRVFPLYFAGMVEGSSVKWIPPLSSSHRKMSAEAGGARSVEKASIPPTSQRAIAVPEARFCRVMFR